MTPPPPPLRFLIAVLVLWTGLRVALWMPDATDGIGKVFAGPAFAAEEPLATAVVAPRGMLPPPRAASAPLVPVSLAARQLPPEPSARSLQPARASPGPDADPAAVDLPLAEVAPFAAAPAAAIAASRWSGSAWLFARAGSRTGLAAASQLGGGQAGARIAYRLAEPIALAARIATPLATARGAEAALGVDLHPLPTIPLRVSIERRFDLGGQGRNAWSAYAAGGVYRSIGRSVDLDGYAQAGVVGAQARDLFADGALRIGRRIALDRQRLLRIGAGAWGAVQPGVSRLDIGPRIALSIPTGGATLSAAIEGRFRIAGDARPGNGVALTLASDF